MAQQKQQQQRQMFRCELWPGPGHIPRAAFLLRLVLGLGVGECSISSYFSTTFAVDDCRTTVGSSLDGVWGAAQYT